MISSLELARLSGCSQGTVDRALHDRPGISEKTKQRILSLAAKHGYRPHPAAREMLTGDRRTIGAIIPSINTVFFMDLLNNVREALGGYHFVITPVADAAQFIEMLGEFAAMRAKMAVVIPPASDILIPASLLKSMGVVSLVNPCDGEGVQNLIPDEVETGRRAAQWLVQKGHRRIIHTCPTRQSPAIRDRADGYAGYLYERSIQSLILRDGDGLIDAIKRFRATALFCHNDWMALSAIRTLNQAGVRVPEDVSVLGVDDSPTFNSLCPDITTLHYPAESIAQAVREVIDGRPAPAIAAASIVERRTVKSRQV